MIGIKQTTGKEIVARYDGRDYRFPSDEKVTTPLSEDAARHIFGFGERDKSRALLRLGWIGPMGTLEQAMERLGKVQFLEVEEVKFKSAETTVALPTSASAAPREEVPLSPEEQELGEKLAHHEGPKKQFGKR